MRTLAIVSIACQSMADITVQSGHYLLDSYQQWRDSLPRGVAQSPIADRLDDVLALRDLAEQLADADLPKGLRARRD